MSDFFCVKKVQSFLGLDLELITSSKTNEWQPLETQSRWMKLLLEVGRIDFDPGKQSTSIQIFY